MPTASATSGHRQSDILARLASLDPEIKLKALRDVKNQIIGNRTKKLSFIKLGAVPAVASILAECCDLGSRDNIAVSIVVQSAAVLGSFACGFDTGVRAVLDAGAFSCLLRLLSSPDDKVVDAGARSLRMIYQSKLAPKYDFLPGKNMEFLFSLLNSENENVSGLGASIISHSCETSAEQKELSKAGALEKLVSLLDGSLSQRYASLESLAILLKNSPEVVSKFMGLEGGKLMNSVSELTKDRCPRTRLLASLCLIVARNTSPSCLQDRRSKTKLINVLLELLDDPEQVGDEAAFAFSTLIVGKEDLQKLALEANAIERLRSHLGTWMLRPRRMEGLLLALADMCSKLEDCRTRFLSLQVLNSVVDLLIHDSADVRSAACVCLRNVARSIKNLSAGHFSCEKILLPLIQLIHDPSNSVQVAALSALSNMVIDFSTRKSVFIHNGGTKQLIELLKSMDPVVRFNALWLLKNLMFFADYKRKESFSQDVKASFLANLISDPEPSVQEQALALLRNLVDGCIQSIDYVFDEDGVLLHTVGRQLQKTMKAEIGIQGMYVLANISSGNEFHKEAVMNQLFFQADEIHDFMLRFLQSSDRQLRTAALWAIINLTCPSSPGAFNRHLKLRNSGIFSQIKNMANDPCLDVKLRVRTVLGQSLAFGD